MSNSRIARAAGLTGSATLASRVLGVVRDQVLAAMFGAGNQMDAFVVAFRIPNLVRDLFAEGALSAAFVPTFTTYLTQRGKGAAWRLANNVLNTLVIVTGLVVVAGIVAAGFLVSTLAGEYAAIPGKLELTIFLTRVMLPFLTLAALAAALMGMLNSLDHYFVPALAPATFNVCVILGALLLAPLMPAMGLPSVTAVALSVLVGGLTQVMFQLPHLRFEGYSYRPTMDLRDPGLHRVLLLMGPGTIGLAATQLNLFINTLLATAQGTGAVSWLSYAFRIMYLPIGLFGVSIATAVLPLAARHAAAEDRVALRDTVSRGLGLMMLLNIPATVGLMILAQPIVQLLFERGRFLPADTAATATAAQMYAVGLMGYATARIASPVFYAVERGRLAVTISGAAVVVNIVASVLLVKWLGFSGLALGTSIAALAHGAIALGALRRQLHGIDGAQLASRLARIGLAAAVMAVVVVLVQRIGFQIAPGTSLGAQSARLGPSIVVGILTFGVTARLLKIPELADALASIKSRVSRTSVR